MSEQQSVQQAPADDPDLLLPPADDTLGQRHAWLVAGCVGLAVLIYLSLWATYAMHGLTDYGRYVQQDPGATARAMGAEYRLLSLVQTDELVNQITDEIESPAINTVWVVARVEVDRQVDDPNMFCVFEILGPQRRVWEASDSLVSRDLTSSCQGASFPVGETRTLETVFEIPEQYVDDLAGVVIDDPVSRGARLVLVPPG